MYQEDVVNRNEKYIKNAWLNISIKWIFERSSKLDTLICDRYILDFSLTHCLWLSHSRMPNLKDPPVFYTSLFFFFCITHTLQKFPRGSHSSLCNEANPLVTTSLSTLWQSLKATVQLPVNILEHRVEMTSTKAADLSSITFPHWQPRYAFTFTMLQLGPGLVHTFSNGWCLF